MKTKINIWLEFALKLLLVASVSFLILVALALWRMSYDDFIHYLVGTLSLQNKVLKLKAFIGPSRFWLLRLGMTVGASLAILLALYLWKNASRIIECCTWFCRMTFRCLSDIKRSVANLTPVQKVAAALLFLVILGERGYYVFIYPFTYDEIFSYLIFVDKGFLVTATYYPGPNNHIFFSLLCGIVDLFSNEPVLIMRLPAFIAGMLVAVIVFLYFLKTRSYAFAFVVTAFLSFAYNIFYYSITGRGYIFILLFFAVSLFSLLLMLDEDSEKKTYFTSVYIVSSVLGFYSIPIFLYPFVSFQAVLLGVALRKRSRAGFRLFIYTSLLVTGGAGLLYLPVVLASGLHALIGNKWVTLYSEGLTYRDYFVHVGNYLWNVSHYGVVLTIVVAIAGILAAWRKKEIWGWIFVSCFCIAPVIAMIQRVHPFGRVWDYLILLFAVAFALVMELVYERIGKKEGRSVMAWMVAVIIGMYGCVQVREVAVKGFPYYSALNKFMKNTFTGNFGSVYVKEENYQYYFQYFARRQHKSLIVATELQDTLPDLVVLSKSEPFPEGLDRNQYEIYDSNPYIMAYRKRQ